MSPRRVTAEEAQSILDACELAARIVRAGGTVAVLEAPGEVPSLLDAAPDLAAEVIALHAELVTLRAQRDDFTRANVALAKENVDLRLERDELRAILAGRTTAPTDAEIEAHARAGGAWVVSERGHVDVWHTPRNIQHAIAEHKEGTRWIPMLYDKPCVWPSPKGSGS